MKWLSALALAAAITSSPSIAQAPEGPLVRANATEKVSEHVHVIQDNSVPGVPNVGFVVGDKAVLVIDTGMGKKNGETVLAEARKLSSGRKLYLVTTHVHPEHDLGAQAFPADTVFIRSEAQVREIAEDGMKTADAFRSRSETNKALLEGAAFRPANETFKQTQNIDLGGVSVRLISGGPSHTQGDTAIWVASDGVLFSGDLAMKAPPAFASSKSSLKQWLASLDALEALKARTIVPSHGPMGNSAYIVDYRAYMTRIQARTVALKKAGKPVDEAVATIESELKADYANTSRVAGAVRAAYAEAG